MATLEELFARRAASGQAFTPVSYAGLPGIAAAAQQKAKEGGRGQAYIESTVGPLERLLASQPFDPTLSTARGGGGDEQFRLRDIVPESAFAPLREDQQTQFARTLRPGEITSEEMARKKFMADNPGRTPESFAEKKEELTGRAWAPGGGLAGSIYTTTENRVIFDPATNTYRQVAGVPTAVRFEERKERALDKTLGRISAGITGLGAGLVTGGMAAPALAAGTTTFGGLSGGALLGGALGGAYGGYTGRMPTGLEIALAGLTAGIGGAAGRGAAAAAGPAIQGGTLAQIKNLVVQLVQSGQIQKAQQVIEATKRANLAGEGQRQEMGFEQATGIPTQADYNRALMEQAEMRKAGQMRGRLRAQRGA